MRGKGTKMVMTAAACDVDKVMTGKEVYPIIGDGLAKDELEVLMWECRGLNLYWDCLRKAYIVKRYLGRGVIVAGSCMAVSMDKRSAYGHYWNPPLELHAWWQEDFRRGARFPIIDIALPGLIAKGLVVVDEVGPMLVDRRSVVLAGMPEQWMQYVPITKILDSEIV